MKTGKGLAEYALAQLNKPYWWGCFGQTASRGLLAAKRRQYPEYYQAGDFESQLGQKVHDCAGLIKGYRWCSSSEGEPVYSAPQDVSAAGLYNECSLRGDIGSIPEIPGVCVFRADLGHVGVYIGGGRVIEAMGHAYGVVETELRLRSWKYWGMPDWIDYEGEGPDAETEAPEKPVYFYEVQLPLLKPGMEDKAVEAAQRMLIMGGYSCGSAADDGEFGPGTEKAVKSFQSDRGLLTDGEIGGDTWRALIRE